ncbi:hypothetical protein O3W44_22695 [Pantoea sp. LMR881]|nr:hypothetical protein [Pantoea sp. LMR881]MCZ4061343.1 hypothetical protein [Pantoea sp. LMR881]
MSDTQLASVPVATQLWDLAKVDTANAPLLRQAYNLIEVHKSLLNQVVINATALGFEGNDIEGALVFLQALTDDSKDFKLLQKDLRAPS